jgi:hypothetical protein
MGFFESIPQPPPPEPVRRHRPRWMRPDAVIPGLVPAELVLVRTEQVAVAVGGVRAYPNGFELSATSVFFRRLRGWPVSWRESPAWFRHSAGCRG